MKDPVGKFIVEVFGNATVLLQVALVVVLALFVGAKFSRKKKSLASSSISFLSENYLVLSFLIALTATIGSLMFSEIAKFTPCKLCWYQRIFMYPQAILFGIATFKNDTKVWLYGFVLSIAGGLIALYHVFLQWYPAIFLPCSDETANCAIKQFALYGYITIPVMSLSAFASLLVLGMIKKGNRF